jgi:hypothetical protein
MQGQDTPKQNVVSLFGNRDKVEATGQEPTADAEALVALSDIMSKNAKNAERVAKERANANKSVLRSYRIKH